MPPEAAARAARNLEQYSLRILGECRSGVSSRELEFTGAADSELSAVGDLLQCFARGDFRDELLLSPRRPPPPNGSDSVEDREETTTTPTGGVLEEGGEEGRAEEAEGRAADEEGGSSAVPSSSASSSSSFKSALELHDRISRSLLVPEALGTVTALNSHRSARLSALQSAFPPIHFAILSLLAVSYPLTCFASSFPFADIPSAHSLTRSPSDE